MVLVVKNLPANAGDARDKSSIPGLRKSPANEEMTTCPVFLPGESHGQKNHTPWGHEESDTTEWLSMHILLNLQTPSNLSLLKTPPVPILESHHVIPRSTCLSLPQPSTCGVSTHHLHFLTSHWLLSPRSPPSALFRLILGPFSCLSSFVHFGLVLRLLVFWLSLKTSGLVLGDFICSLWGHRLDLSLPVVCHPELCAFLGQETGEEGWMSGWMEPTFQLSMGLCEREVCSYS